MYCNRYYIQNRKHLNDDKATKLQIKDGFKHSCKLIKKIYVIKNINIMSCLGKANLIHQKKIPKHNITYLDGKLNKLAYCSSLNVLNNYFLAWCQVGAIQSPKLWLLDLSCWKKKKEYLPMTWFIVFFFFFFCWESTWFIL